MDEVIDMALLDDAKVYQEINQADLEAAAKETEELANKLADAANKRADILKAAIVAAGVDDSNITVENTAGTAYVSVGMPEIGQEKIIEFEIQPTDESTLVFVYLRSEGAEPQQTNSLALYSDKLKENISGILVPHVAKLVPIAKGEPVVEIKPAAPPANKSGSKTPAGTKVVTDVISPLETTLTSPQTPLTPSN